MENDPRRRRPRGRRSPRDTQKPQRPPAQPRPPGIRGGPARDPGPPRAGRRPDAARSEPARPDGSARPGRDGRDGRGARGGRSQRSRGRPAGGQAAPRDPAELRPGTPCVIVVDCREGEPDRSGAAALFEGFFDLETGDPRRLGTGHPRLRIVAPAVPPVSSPETPLAITSPDPTPVPDVAAETTPVRPPRPVAPVVERLWGFECWWRPDPTRAGLTPADHEEIEQSKALLRGLLRDTRRRGSLQPR